jgi:hypothetical protein
MSHRLIAALLWFAVVWVGYEIAWSVADVPRVLGPALAMIVSAFVALDPMGLFFARPARTQATPEQPAGALSSSH